MPAAAPKAVIEKDMLKLQSSITMCMGSIENYKTAIKQKKSEQQDLQVLIKNPGYYNVEALQRNVDACDQHIEEFQKVIKSEQDNMEEYHRIYNVLKSDLNSLEVGDVVQG